MFLSVVIPFHNNAQPLERCLRSIEANRQMDDVETIIVDDGSAVICATEAKQCVSRRPEARIRLVQQSHKGAAAARNLGLSMAQGTWVWFVDADDLLLPHSIDLLREATVSIPAHTDLLKMGPLMVTDDSGLIPTHRQPDATANSVTSLQELVAPRSGCLDHTTYLFRREFLMQHGITYPEEMLLLEDSTMMTLALSKASLNMANSTLQLYIHCQQGYSSTQGGWDREKSTLYMRDIISFFGTLQSWLSQNLPVQQAEAFWSRYLYVYLRVLSVKGVPWHLIADFRQATLDNCKLRYLPQERLGKLLVDSRIHRIFTWCCLPLRPIIHGAKRVIMLAKKCLRNAPHNEVRP